MPKDETPKLLKPFMALGFTVSQERGTEAIGTCLLCDREGKLHINVETGQWSCKSGICGKSGNLYTFLHEWWEMMVRESGQGAPLSKWKELSENRGIPVNKIKDAGVVYDGSQWIIPLFNSKRHVIAFQTYRIGNKIYAMSGLDVGLWGMEKLADKSRSSEPVYLCEGFWDGLSLEIMLETDGEPGIVVASPGCEVFKDAWVDALAGRELINCYDKDAAGQRGVQKVWKKVGAHVRSYKALTWPEIVPDKYDLRDLYKDGGNSGLVKEMAMPYRDEERTPQQEANLPLLSSGGRPSFDSILEVYKQWLHMTDDMIACLKVIYAVHISNQIGGDPLWMHVVSPPGSGKTELLMTISECSQVIARSTLTAHSLVSGFVGPGGSDPSLIPQLFGNTFILKDFTEVLRMPRTDKDTIYSVLRGAFDGKVEKSYGNGIERIYAGYFTMISGVTPSIYAEQGATLGERFLMFHMMKGVGFNVDDILLSAISRVGEEVKMKAALSETAQSFLNYRIESSDLPSIPVEYLLKIVALAQIVSMLRAGVEKDFFRDKIFYRPQHEVGTRVAKQLKKLLMGLALINDDRQVSEESYQLTARVAMDTCIGFNLEIIRLLIEGDGLSAAEVAEKVNIPLSTIREHLEDLTMLGVLEKRREDPTGRVGTTTVIYTPTATITKHWNNAGLSNLKREDVERPRIRRIAKKSKETS